MGSQGVMPLDIFGKPREVLIGCILGDGYLQKTGKRNARLRLEHQESQKDYLLWKIKWLKRIFQGKPKRIERIHPKTGKKSVFWRHQSQSMPYLGKLRKLFYENGKKRIPEKIEKWFSPLSLAVLYMDDGYIDWRKKAKAMVISLAGFEKKDVEVLKRIIEKKFNIFPRIHKEKKGWRLYFPQKEAEKLASLIKPYILPLFSYKLPDPVTTSPENGREPEGK